MNKILQLAPFAVMAAASKQLVAPVMLMLGSARLRRVADAIRKHTLVRGPQITGSFGIATSTPTPTPIPPTATPTPNIGGPCEGFITFTGKTTSGDLTTYNYSFSRNAPSGGNCLNMSFIAFQVCFNPILSATAGRIHTETHPSGWSYVPDNGGADKRVKWNAGAGVGAPLAGLLFSITVEGPLGPDAQAPYQIHAGGGAPVYEVGKTVTVPHPTSCGSTTPFTNLGIAPTACLPLALKNVGTNVADGNTTFKFHLTGGSATGREGCPAIEQVLVPVCFNPAIEPAGWLADAESAGHWRYSGKMEDMQASPALPRAIAWTRTGGQGPWSARVEIVAPGTGLPTTSVHAIGRASDGKDYDLGEVQVPKPAACDALPPAPSPTNVVAQPTATTGPNNAPAPTATATPEPTRTPRPGTTPDNSGPRATPTPELIGGVVWE